MHLGTLRKIEDGGEAAAAYARSDLEQEDSPPSNVKRLRNQRYDPC